MVHGNAEWFESLRPTRGSSPEYVSVFQAILAVNWSETCMGPLGIWDASTRSIVSFILRTEQSPFALFLGRDKLVLYNAMATKFYQAKHPAILGQPYATAFQEMDVVDELVSDLDTVLSTGRTHIYDMAAVKFVRTLGLEPEEMFPSWEFVPVTDDLGACTSVLVPFTDHTPSVREMQRAQFLAELQTALTDTTDCPKLYDVCRDLFSHTVLHFPFMYLFKKDPHGSQHCVASFDRSGDSTVAAAYQELVRQKISDQMQTKLIQLPSFASPEKVVSALIHPVTPPQDTTLPTHILVLGVNPNHPMDELNRSFHGSCATMIATGLGIAQSSILLDRSDDRYQEMLQKTQIGYNVEDELTRMPTFVNHAWRESELPIS